MGLFDQLASQALSSLLGNKDTEGNVGNDNNAMVQIAMNVLNSQGGLSGLLGKLNSAGLSEQTASWVGTGENKPVDGGALSAALGSDAVTSLAEKFGLSAESVSTGLAALLPQIIDQATPEGSTEGSDSLLNEGLSALTKMLGK